MIEIHGVTMITVGTYDSVKRGMFMEYIFETNYDKKTLKTMARIVRKTVRKKHSRRSHTFGWLVIIFGILMFFLNGGFIDINFQKVITGMAVLAIIIALLFEDQLNGYFAGKRMLPGTKSAITKFTEDGYTSEVKAGTTEWKYENIELVAETSDYFAFVFGQNHAQVFEKNSLVGGTIDGFRTFIKDKTGKQIQQVK